jgi:3-oxosteroid 1-dehydrogenase
MTTWDDSFDFVIVGSGGGGMVAALAAADSGLRPVVIEKQSYVGGSTAMSGGVIWMPNNPLMRADGVPDSYADALAYFDAVVGPPDKGSSLARRETFLTRGVEMISFMQRQGVKLVRCEGFSDYYDNRQGGSARGRSVEGIPWDGRQLGEWQSRIQPGMARAIGLAVKTNEMRSLPAFLRSRQAFATSARVLIRSYVGQLRGQDLFTNGMSLIGQLAKVALDVGIPIWTNTGVQELIIEEGRVTGVRAERDGSSICIRGHRGVLLAAGGFERNAEMRRKYSADTKPNEAQWTRANLGNTGEVLNAAIAIGANTDYMDEAVWNPQPRPELAVSTLSTARQYPHAIFVNQRGRRFCNEAGSYVEIGQAMYANDAVPAWLIFDDNYRRRYPLASGFRNLRSILKALPGRMPREWVDNGWLREADSLSELARLIGADPQTLTDTVRRYNAGARTGSDPEFGRGESQHNRSVGDPGNKVNPSVGPLDKPPFYATEVFPGDVGTSGGVLADERARVLDNSDRPIAGLYATGNMSATVMGRTYPGAGASIANTMVFGYVAARHAATGDGRA